MKQMIFKDIGKGRAYNADCFDVMKLMPDGCVDMLFADLPYGTTQNKWDTVIPFEKIWPEFNRICKPAAAMVFTASQPFTSALVMSNVKNFKYDWTWQKEMGSGHLNAKKMPMKSKEDILIFYRKQPTYNPQFRSGKPYTAKSKGALRVKQETSDCYGKFSLADRNDSNGQRYPEQIIQFSRAGNRGLHPTQKPAALLEYLIKTYSNEGELIFDPTAGSLTTGVAAENLGRRWVCCEMGTEHGYFEKGLERFSS